MRAPTLLATLLAAALSPAAPSVGRADHSRSAQARVGYMGVQLRLDAGGLVVVDVPARSPAAIAGVQPGDVIVRARGGPVATVEMFTTSVRAAGAGTTYPLVIRRAGRQMSLSVTLAQLPQPASMVAVGGTPPTLSAQLVMGSGPTDLAALRGRVVILDFWATWCGPCRMVMPSLNRLHQRYAAQGLTVLGVTDESASLARALGAQMSIGYTLATDASASTRFGVTGLPTMLVIGRDGTVRRVIVGADGTEMRRLDALVQQLLAEHQP